MYLVVGQCQSGKTSFIKDICKDVSLTPSITKSDIGNGDGDCKSTTIKFYTCETSFDNETIVLVDTVGFGENRLFAG